MGCIHTWGMAFTFSSLGDERTHKDRYAWFFSSGERQANVDVRKRRRRKERGEKKPCLLQVTQGQRGRLISSSSPVYVHPNQAGHAFQQNRCSTTRISEGIHPPPSKKAEEACMLFSLTSRHRKLTRVSIASLVEMSLILSFCLRSSYKTSLFLLSLGTQVCRQVYISIHRYTYGYVSRRVYTYIYIYTYRYLYKDGGCMHAKNTSESISYFLPLSSS